MIQTPQSVPDLRGKSEPHEEGQGEVLKQPPLAKIINVRKTIPHPGSSWKGRN